MSDDQINEKYQKVVNSQSLLQLRGADAEVTKRLCDSEDYAQSGCAAVTEELENWKIFRRQLQLNVYIVPVILSQLQKGKGSEQKEVATGSKDTKKDILTMEQPVPLTIENSLTSYCILCAW